METNTIIYQYFGSEDSRDRDIVFFVPGLPPTLEARSNWCKALAQAHRDNNRDDRPINANIAIATGGRLLEVHKGTTDELNNALYVTYCLHRQDFEPQVRQRLPRNTDLKFIRCTRMLLSALTKTVFRAEVKRALQGNIQQRIAGLRTIDFEQVKETTKGYSPEDIRKLAAFQLGQTLALDKGLELYTKSRIAFYYPQLQDYLQRAPQAPAGALNDLLAVFINRLEQRVVHMHTTEEQVMNPIK